MTFSVVVLEALERAGVPVEKQDKEDYLHLWIVVAHLLGLHQEHCQMDMVTAPYMTARIRREQWAESPQGKLLTRQLVNNM